MDRYTYKTPEMGWIFYILFYIIEYRIWKIYTSHSHHHNVSSQFLKKKKTYKFVNVNQ